MSFQKSLPQAGVSAPHFLAARAGRQILEAGGTALEAAVATAASLAVVYPHMNSIGGDSFWLIKKKGEAPVGVLACGQAAERASVDFYETRGLAAVPPRGAFAAVTVPGTIRGWQALLSLSGHPRRLTLKDILSVVIGEFSVLSEDEQIVQRSDGTWLVDGATPVDDVERMFNIDRMPEEENYETVSGFMMYMLRKIPKLTDKVEFEGYRFEVIGVENRRVDQVLVTKIDASDDQENTEESKA